MGTHLETTHESIVDIIIEQLLAHILTARPAPEIFGAPVCLGTLVDGRGDHPHNQIKGKKADGQHRVIHGVLLGELVATAPVAVEDHQTGDQRDARDC